MLQAQIGAEPGNRQHGQAATDHDAEGQEWNEHGRAVFGREARQADLLGGQAQACDHAPENRNFDFIVVGLCGRIGYPNQDFAGWLFIVPAAFDRGEFRRLIVVHVVADEMAEVNLER